MTDEYDINQVSPETRAEVAAAVLEMATTQTVSAYQRYYRVRDKLVAEGKLKALPSKAEVDAEIADAMRENVKLGPASDNLTPLRGGFSEKIRLLCAKPFAPPGAVACNSVSELEQELAGVRGEKDRLTVQLEDERKELERVLTKLDNVRNALEVP